MDTLVVYGDFNCPYSALASLRADRLVEAGVTEVEWRAVEHDPEIPAEGRPVGGVLSQMYDRELTQVVGLLQEGELLELRRPPAQPNTNAAVAAFAGTQGRQERGHLRRALFHALWAEGRNIGDPDELRRLGASQAEPAPEQVGKWRQSWLGLERHLVPMMVLPDGRVSRGLGALTRLSAMAGGGALQDD